MLVKGAPGRSTTCTCCIITCLSRWVGALKLKTCVIFLNNFNRLRKVGSSIIKKTNNMASTYADFRLMIDKFPDYYEYSKVWLWITFSYIRKRFKINPPLEAVCNHITHSEVFMVRLDICSHASLSNVSHKFRRNYFYYIETYFAESYGIPEAIYAPDMFWNWYPRKALLVKHFI